MNNAQKCLLWVIHEQCVYNGRAHANLLTHGAEAFAAVGLKDGCDASEIEKLLFEPLKDQIDRHLDRHRTLKRLKDTNTGETICLSYQQIKTLVEWIEELEKGENK